MKKTTFTEQFNIFYWSRRDNFLILRDYNAEEMTITQHIQKSADFIGTQLFYSNAQPKNQNMPMKQYQKAMSLNKKRAVSPTKV